METHSYCNRRCSYCPNVVGDRIGPNQFMPADILEKIYGGLEEINYDRYLILNYYNEPLADRSIIARISEARARLPNARIMIYSNGDYLDRAFIEELAERPRLSAHLHPPEARRPLHRPLCGQPDQ
nr:radical SAM protein [Phenylobacterium aquaticum]